MMGEGTTKHTNDTKKLKMAIAIKWQVKLISRA